MTYALQFLSPLKAVWINMCPKCDLRLFEEVYGKRCSQQPKPPLGKVLRACVQGGRTAARAQQGLRDGVEPGKALKQHIPSQPPP
jgi:hypothetical protein